jgi:hypothetical protein
MSLSKEAWASLAGMWGSYDFRLIRDKHFLTASDMVEKFLEYYVPLWSASTFRNDPELAANLQEVRTILVDWTDKKLQTILEEAADETVQAHIMFKRLNYGDRQTIDFGSKGANWKKKAEIAKELHQYRPWSIEHAIAAKGSKKALADEMMAIVNSTGSPTERKLWAAWRKFSNSTDRPMLFPQVQGHSGSGTKFWLRTPRGTVPIHFDFGIVNVVTRKKILIECDSRRYHSKDWNYQNDRVRQNIAERAGWSVRRFTYEDVMHKLDYCFENLRPDLFY